MKKKTFKKGLLLLLLLAIFALKEVQAKSYDFYVDDSAEEKGDGSKDKPFETIQEAIDEAEDEGGGDVFVSKGNYKENLKVAKKVHLFGQDRDGTVIEGTVILKDDSSLEELTVKGRGTAVTIEANADAKINDCRVKNFGKMGINAEPGGGKLTVTGSIIEDGSGKGFYLQRGKEIYLANNKIVDNGEEGVDVRSKVEGEIRENEIRDNGESGIEIIVGSSQVRIVSNVLEDNGSSGVATQFYEDFDKRGQVEIKGNKVRSNKKFGLDCAIPSGGKPDSSYWRDSLELIDNNFEKNKEGAINSFCNLIEAVDENEAEDNLITEGAPEETETEEKTEEELAVQLAQERQERVDELNGQLGETFVEQEVSGKKAEKLLKKREAEKKFKRWLVGSDEKMKEELKKEIDFQEERLQQGKLLIDRLEREEADVSTWTLKLEEETKNLQAQKEILKEMEAERGLLGWLKDFPLVSFLFRKLI